MKIARENNHRTNPFFIIVICFISIISLQLLAAALLYYQQIIDENLQFAEAATTPKQYLWEQTQKRGMDYDLLYTIIDCESRWRMVKNDTSTAYGFFQILDRTEKYTPQYTRGERKFDPFTTIDMGIYLYTKYGTSPWQESRKCWGHLIDPA